MLVIRKCRSFLHKILAKREQAFYTEYQFAYIYAADAAAVGRGRSLRHETSERKIRGRYRAKRAKS